MVDDAARRPLATWSHADGRKVVVFPDCKVRVGYTSQHRGVGSSSRDEWPILYRREVPNLTDQEWIAAPNEEGWVMV